MKKIKKKSRLYEKKNREDNCQTKLLRVFHQLGSLTSWSSRKISSMTLSVRRKTFVQRSRQRYLSTIKKILSIKKRNPNLELHGIRVSVSASNLWNVCRSHRWIRFCARKVNSAFDFMRRTRKKKFNCVINFYAQWTKRVQIIRVKRKYGK